MKRLYIAGPMTGHPDLNFPAFHAAAAALRAAGYDAVSPAELCDDIAGQWAACMRRDLTALLTCDGVALLPGWEASKGATLEHHIAERLGMSITTVAALLAPPAPRRNGCHDRRQFVDLTMVQDGWVQDGTRGHLSRRADMVSVPFRMQRECQYTHTALGQADAACAGCKHRAEVAS